MASTAAPTVINQNFQPEDAQKLLQSLKSTSISTGNTQIAPASGMLAPTNTLQAAPRVVKNTQSVPQLAPPIIPRSQSPATTNTPVFADNNYSTNKISSLEDTNRALQSQLNAAHRQISNLKSGTNTATGIEPNSLNNISASPTGLEPNNLNNIQGFPTGGVVNNPMVALNPSLAPGNLNLRGAIPQLVPTPSQKQVHLELLGVKAKNKNINLKVRLRNDQDQELVLPANQKAIIRMSGTEDKTANIKFPKRKLKAHSTMEGYIKVPGKRLSPAADVFIPELAGLNEAKENVHLTLPLPISSLNSTNN